MFLYSNMISSKLIEGDVRCISNIHYSYMNAVVCIIHEVAQNYVLPH
jgi:hypothetical protein